MKKKEVDEETRRQLQRIDRLARRIPWIVLGISLLAFLIIFLEILLKQR